MVLAAYRLSIKPPVRLLFIFHISFISSLIENVAQVCTTFKVTLVISGIGFLLSVLFVHLLLEI
jgi:hypothetical protein